MDFSEAVKRKARERAHYTCIWCHHSEFFLEVHHIDPQKDDGLSDLDNAAPMCTQCHRSYGDNPTFRKQIKERRDWWWQYCAERQPPEYRLMLERLNEVAEQVRAAEAASQNRDTEIQQNLNALKSAIYTAIGGEPHTLTFATTMTEVVQGSTGLLEANSEGVAQRYRSVMTKLGLIKLGKGIEQGSLGLQTPSESSPSGS